MLDLYFYENSLAFIPHLIFLSLIYLNNIFL